MRRLDTLNTRLYNARPLAVLLSLLSGTARAELVNGAQIPVGAQKVAERRYRVTQNYEDALKYYKTVYPTSSYPRRAIIHQPGVKAVHIVNPSGKGFEGLNIYEANDEVRIYIVTAGEAPKPAAKKKEAKKK